MNAKQQLDQVTGNIFELRGQQAQAGQRAEAAQLAIDNLRRQVIEMRKRVDMGAPEAGKSLAAIEKLLADEQAALAESTRAATELSERITALHAELPKLQRAAIVERRNELLPEARAAMTAYRTATGVYVKAAAAAQSLLSAIQRLEEANGLESALGARLLSASELNTAILRALSGSDPGLDDHFNNWKV